jgi:hypothetical protein
MFAMLYNYCREVAEAETRTITIFEKSDFNLPAGHYSFIEMFCSDRNCDCRRCLFMVRADWASDALAYIGFGWEKPEFYTKWMGDDELSDQLAGADLEPFQTQSSHASEILRLFKSTLLPDRDYVERVKRHYTLMRRTVDATDRRSNKAKDRKRSKTQRRKNEKRDIRVATSGASGQKVVKPFDKSTYRHPTGKISAAFLEYVNHVIDLGSTPRPSLESANQMLKLCWLVWNAVVMDTTEGGTKHIDKLLSFVPDKSMRLMIEFLINLKQSEFGNDQRMIGFYECIPEGDSYRLRVEATHPSALGPLPKS